jgi:sugar lactone lactonase YvrE
MTTAEQVTEALAYHGEGPVWDVHRGAIRWVDMLAGDVLTTDPASGQTSRLHVDTVAAAMRPRAGGGLVVGVERGFCLVDADESGPQQPVEVWTDTTVRMNDGGCDPQGRFYCGSMAYDQAPGRGSLYRLDPNGDVRRVLDDATISNGIAWSHDGASVYYVDTPTQRVDVFDFDADTGELSGRRPVVQVDPEQGAPDGMTLDAEGGIWVALYGGGAVHRYSPEGKLDEVIELEPRKVTACTFGGEGFDELFITTSRENLPDDADPTAGALFRCSPGVTGVPPNEFRG